MPSVYLKKEPYDTIIRLELDVTEFVNDAVIDKLKEIEEEKDKKKKEPDESTYFTVEESLTKKVVKEKKNKNNDK